ncbi:MAG TPA: hypothetical protein VKZ18_17950 [Polyangia bacterium]|nr:hypothetical protein [Polyangia bacterium]
MNVPSRVFSPVILALGVSLAGCAGVTGRASTGGAAGAARPPVDASSAGATGGRPSVGTGGSRDAGPAVVDSGPAPITDFPPDPIIDPGAPSNAPTLFTTAPRSSGAPCLLQPEPGTLMPRNWLRPLFQYTRAADENLFEITLTVPSFAHPLVIYTTAMSYTLPKAIWDGLRVSVNDQPVAVTVRALTLSGTGTVQNPPSPPAMADFTIAPVDAPGKIVYWALPSGGADGILRGFGVGEEGVEDVLTSSTLVSPAINTAQNDGCIGCHSATPDGLSVGFQLGPHDNGSPHTFYDSIAQISGAALGQVPSYVTTAQLAVIRMLRGIPAYSRSHWSMGDHVVLLMDGDNQGQLLWVNLDTDGEQGTVARTGDPGGAAEATFSHDGTQIVYVSGNSFADGRFSYGPGDLYAVPYGNRAGGTAQKVTGAADPGYTEYYPAFSPDDAYLAFTRFQGTGDSYSNPQAEVLVVPAGGGTATRFGANDPPACQSGAQSPGVTNDWAKWSPEATTAANGKTYYWVVFSSKRSGHAQLYLAAMTVTAGTIDATYPALYLWNQPATDDNHTPSWDDYQIPSITIGYVGRR